MLLSWLPWFAGRFGCSLACRCMTLTSAFIFTWHSPCEPVGPSSNSSLFKDMVICMRLTLIISSSFDHLQRSYFQIRHIHQWWELEFQHFLVKFGEAKGSRHSQIDVRNVYWSYLLLGNLTISVKTSNLHSMFVHAVHT